MFDLTSALTPKEGRDIEAITNDILEAKRRGGEAILTIGRCLTEAKQSLPHGEWLPWLNERVELSERTAQKFMKLAREWSNPNTLADLGASKALMLLALPESEREHFAEDHNVIDMSARQLEQAIRERKEAQEAAARAEAEAKTAEEARAKMEEDMKLLNARLSGAQEDRKQAAQAAARLEAELEELKARPVEVAVETVVDQEAIEKARAEAVAEMQDKLNKAREAKEAAEARRKNAEEALEQIRLQLEEQARAEKADALEGAVLNADNEVLSNRGDDPDLAIGVVWHTRDDEPDGGSEIIVIDDLGCADSNVYIGGGAMKEQGIQWDEVVLWTQMPHGPTVSLDIMAPPAKEWVPLQFVNGKEHPPRSGKYYCRFHCEGTVVTQTAWWDGFLKSWVFKENGVKIDAICLGWFPLPEEKMGEI